MRKPDCPSLPKYNYIFKGQTMYAAPAAAGSSKPRPYRIHGQCTYIDLSSRSGLKKWYGRLVELAPGNV